MQKTVLPFKLLFSSFMDFWQNSTLCLFFKGDDVSSCIIQRGITGTSLDVLGFHQQPLRSVVIKDGCANKYIFGFDASQYVDLLHNYCLLNSISDFLHYPVLSNPSVDPQTEGYGVSFE